MAIRTRILVAATYGYLTLPFLIFAGGYLKIPYAVPVVLIVGFSLIKAIKEEMIPDMPVLGKKEIAKLTAVGVILLVWVILSGIGGVFFQNSDHPHRNAVFNCLVNLKWPVAHGMTHGGGAQMRTLIYYIGFWLPSALVGKVFSLQAGYLFQIFWAWLGLMLMYCLLCVFRKKVELWPLVVLIFFSGLDVIRQELYMHTPLFSTGYLDFGKHDFNYASFITDLNGPYNTTVPCFLTTMLVINQPKRSNVIFVWSTLLLSAAFPFIGIIPYVLYVIFRKENGESIADRLRETCSLQNIAGAGLIGIISFVFIVSGAAAADLIKIPGQLAWNSPVMLSAAVQSMPILLSQAAAAVRNALSPMIQNKLGYYVIFIFFEVGIYFALLFQTYKKNVLFWITVGSLLVIPWIRAGEGFDFCVKASVPALLVLAVMVITRLGSRGKRRIVNILLVICLCIGSVSGIHHMADSFRLQMLGEKKQTLCANIIFGGYNFSGDMDNLFFRYLARERKPETLSELTVIEAIRPEDMYLVEDYYLGGITFSLELNSLATTEFFVQFDTAVERDVYFEDVGILMDASVEYQLIVNGHAVGVMDYQHTNCYIPMEYFNEEAQFITIVPNKEIKIYDGDYIYLRF
ncbi:MAG: hypothetical protein NC409_03055 [Clostridium sp.]|nr:hypothetical protein [Clostridium sp.]